MPNVLPITNPHSNATEKAIRAALEGKWEEAIEFNLYLIKDEPGDITALNRLAKAYTEIGDIEKAGDTYKKVLSLDKYNPIATKNLIRLKSKEKVKIQSSINPSPAIQANFLEEPGKTKSTQLVRLTDADNLASLHIGQSVILEAKKRSVSVLLSDGTYIGTLPDDLSFRLGRLIRGGNKYETFVKGLPANHGVLIFIRETERSRRYKNTPSFPMTTHATYQADLRHTELREEPLDTRETGEDEEV